MTSHCSTATPPVLQTPAGIFVIHVRSDSDLPHEHVVGRVEHVMSGDSERFASLAGLLAFMNRYVATLPAAALEVPDGKR